MSTVKKNFPGQGLVDPRASTTAVQFRIRGRTNLGAQATGTHRQTGIPRCAERRSGARAVKLRLQFENSHRQYHSRVCARDEPLKDVAGDAAQAETMMP